MVQVVVRYVGPTAQRCAAQDIAEHLGFSATRQLFRQLKMVRGVAAELQGQAVSSIVLLLWVFGVSGYPVNAIICRYAGLAAYNRWKAYAESMIAKGEAQ